MSSLGSTSQRRTFKKSFSGCRECRQRKVKCDEVHPICGRCQRHFKYPRPCDWSTNLPLSSHKRNSLSTRRKGSLTSSRISSHSFSPTPPTPFGISDKLTIPLRLFYNFTSATVFALPQIHNPSVLACWTVDTPQLAFHCDYLLHGLLAISAMHILYTRAPSDDSLFTAVRFYFDKSIRSFQDSLTNIGAHNAEQIMITGMMLGMLAGPVTRGCRLPPKGTRYELPMVTLRMIKALENLMVRTVPFLQETNIIALTTTFGAPGMQHLPRRQFLRPEDTTDLEVLLQDLDPIGSEFDIYNAALEHVRILQQSCVTADPAPMVQRKFTRFAIFMSDGFTDLLEQEDPRAMVILAHQFAMGRFLENTPWGWFLAGMAEYNVKGIESLLPFEGVWRELMGWPKHIVGMVLKGIVKDSITPLVEDRVDIVELLE